MFVCVLYLTQPSTGNNADMSPRGVHRTSHPGDLQDFRCHELCAVERAVLIRRRAQERLEVGREPDGRNGHTAVRLLGQHLPAVRSCRISGWDAG